MTESSLETEISTPESRPRRRRLPWVLAGLVLFIALLLTLLPLAIRYGVERALAVDGVRSAVIRDVDFNVFKGALAVTGMQVTVEGQSLLNLQQAELRVAWRPLLSRKLVVEQFILRDADIAIRQDADGHWHIGQPASEEAVQDDTAEVDSAPPWGVGVEQLVLENCRLAFTSPRLTGTMQVETASLSGLRSWEAGTAAALSLRGSINDSALTLQAQLAPFAEAPWATGKLALESFNLAPVATLVPETVSQLSGRLSVDSQWDARYSAQELAVETDGSVSLQQPVINVNEDSLQGERLAWQGTLTAQVSLTGAESIFAANGELDSAGLDIRLPGQDLVIAQGSQSVKGAVHFPATEEHPLFAGELSMADVSLRQPGAELMLFSAAGLELDALTVTDVQNVQATGLGLRTLRALQRLSSDEVLLTLDAAQLGGLAYGGEAGIAIETVDLSRPQLHLTRTAAGGWALIDDLSKTPPSAADSTQAAEPAADSAAMPLRIGRIALRDGGRVEFRDASVTPAFASAVDFSELSIADLDNSKPQQASPYVIKGKFGKYSSLDLTGQVKPFASRLGLVLEGKLTSFELPALSPYTSREIGYKLSSGHMDAETRFHVVDGKIDASNQLAFNNLTVSPGDSKKKQGLDKSLSMPLDSALNMLRDKDDNIRLALPVSGDINDPNLDLSDVINKALGSALKTAAVSYLKLAVQPYGALISIVQKVGEAAATVRMQPVAFTAGKVELDSTARDYLLKLAEVLNQRPALRVSLCGLGVEADRAALAASRQAEKPVAPASPPTEAASAGSRTETAQAGSAPAVAPVPPVDDDTVTALGQSRAEAIKAWLVSEQAIAAERVFVCHSELDAAAEALPRVELHL